MDEVTKDAKKSRLIMVLLMVIISGLTAITISKANPEEMQAMQVTFTPGTMVAIQRQHDLRNAVMKSQMGFAKKEGRYAKTLEELIPYGMPLLRGGEGFTVIEAGKNDYCIRLETTSPLGDATEYISASQGLQQKAEGTCLQQKGR